MNDPLTALQERLDRIERNSRGAQQRHARPGRDQRQPASPHPLAGERCPHHAQGGRMKDIHVPAERLTNPPGGGLMERFHHRYWVVVDGCLVFHQGRSPQCNENRELVERHASRHGGVAEWFEDIWVPMALATRRAGGETTGVDVEPRLKHLVDDA